MHLLNVNTRKLERFGDSNVPLYAILSHTWDDVEITYQDIQSPGIDKRPEYEKVKRTCELAATHGHDYMWIDTCCIDKTSSAELSEAINSMFNWYRDAAICYAYLADVELNDPDSLRLPDWNSDFFRSRWFTRGWTLQELIAPRIVVFFNRCWREIGTKTSLKEAISSTTGIPPEVLLGRELQSSSVAQKMCWAANRKTSRIEDRAYSLLGIFGVNMPLLYGEGERSFERLQEEIIRVTDDYSIFAWQSFGTPSGLLARIPDVFQNSHDVVLDNSLPPSD
ncbi:hypothetical protein H2200_012540 [Cladophialophora chaetospira]|uniref:HET-domain-containing protein n=1 Tax=Cladophialophora chaetospira TaxID=386627 RepID=A0AA38WX60_9EURO|nr:hypothetical protein H2200_012540 [Cladophialophora chaetospira]